MIICPWKDIKKYASLLPGIEEAFDAVNALTDFEAKVHPLSGENRFEVAVATTKPVDLGEAHRKYIDVQCMIKGGEVVGWAPLADCKPEGEFIVERMWVCTPAISATLRSPWAAAMWHSPRMSICPPAIWMFPMTTSK